VIAAGIEFYFGVFEELALRHLDLGRAVGVGVLLAARAFEIVLPFSGALVYLGALGLSVGWGLFQIFNIMSANVSGILTGEWRAALALYPASPTPANRGWVALMRATCQARLGQNDSALATLKEAKEVAGFKNERASLEKRLSL